MNGIKTYIISNKDRRPDRYADVVRQFSNKSEFDVQMTQCIFLDDNRRYGLWLSMMNCIADAKKNAYEKCILVEDDAYFTDYYNENTFLQYVNYCESAGYDILNGGIYGTSNPIRNTDKEGLWDITWCWATHFIVVYNKCYDKLLNYKFELHADVADGVLNKLGLKRAVMYPFMVLQKDYGYTDITFHTVGHMAEMLRDTNKVFEDRLNKTL